MNLVKTYLDSRAWVEVNLCNLQNNVKAFQSVLPKECKIMAAVKANAYGHGAILVATHLQEYGVTHFCVASVQEGIDLRKAGIKGDILILSYTPKDQLDLLIEYNLIQTIVDMEYAFMLRDFQKNLRVHVGIDTGMHRLGERAERIEEIAKIWEFKNLHIEGIFSHLCVADSLESEDVHYTKEQIKKFNQAIETLKAKGKSSFATHLQGSYGVLNYPECQYDYARLGISLYGALSSSKDQTKVNLDLKPVLTLKSRISCIKHLKVGEKVGYGLAFQAIEESDIAVVSIGYADGIPRNLSERGYVLCHGKKAPIVGRICMDQLFIDVTKIPESKTNDEVVMIGSQEKENISAEMVADCVGTISNEILSRLGNRLERIVTTPILFQSDPCK
ncbi:MAG: serine racemase VanT catalytic subunit [Candidatus Galacturonibacter soehngenii]|nr:serine racemase VanT catalytic subunit [Candidatus Galacturonibacter soehngenii]